MIRVVIIDDEVLVRLGVAAYLEDYKEICVAGVFAEAMEALAYLEKNAVDVVITDIEMAQMNGLEFIREVKRNEYACSIIILSCHDNFEYAREAMRVGADTYILKHEVDKDMLVEEISKVSGGKNGIRISPASGRTPNFAATQVSLVENDKYRIGVLELKEKYREDGAVLVPDVDEKLFHGLIENLLVQKRNCTVIVTSLQEMFLLFHVKKEEEEIKFAEYRVEILELLSENIRQYVNTEMAMGFSGEFYNLDEMKKRYREAVQTVKNRFYVEDKILYPVASSSQSPAWETGAGFTGETLQLLFDHLRNDLQEYVRNARTTCTDPDEVKHTCKKALFSLCTFIGNKYAMDQSDLEEMLQWISMSEIDGYNRADRYEAGLIALEEQLYRRVEEKINLCQKDYRNIITWVDEHCLENLVLSQVAASFYLTPNYFCRVFKEMTGKTFTNYLNEQRVSRVKKYLREENYSLEKIAEMTGFNHVNYLTRVFKKMEGITIREFRKNKGS